MSLTARVSIALIAGLLAGLAVSTWPTPTLRTLAAALGPVGTLWLNAIRMTVVPLVVASLIVGVTKAPDLASLGRVGWRALVVFVSILTLGATGTVLVARPVLARLTIDPATVAALRAGPSAPGPSPSAPAVTTAAATTAMAGTAAATTTRQRPWSEWLTDLVPPNPVKAAADGALLPLILFTLALALALLRVDAERRRPVISFFTGIFDAMLVLVRWVLALAPVGVFALALPLAATMGLAAAGALGVYIVLVSLLSVLFTVTVLYPAATVLGRTPFRRFARAAAPAQAVAFSSRSSLATIPAMIEAAAHGLDLPTEVSSFFIPLAATTFRAGAGVAGAAGTLFLARLYGVTPTPAQLATVIVTVVVTSFSVPGIPGGSIVVMIPALLAAGLPDAGVGLLLGIDTIPDMFRTATNVTGDLAAATIVARGSPGPRTPPDDAAGAVDPRALGSHATLA